MQVVIAGSSGFLGTALTRILTDKGHHVVSLVRRQAGTGEFQWDPYDDRIDQALIDNADVVVNLAGSPTVGNPHSRRWATELRESRVTTTSVLAKAIARSHLRGTGQPAYLAGNGISVYGDHGDDLLDESADSRGSALLTEVTREWEAATGPARDADARVCILRTAPVIDRGSAPLKQLLPLFRAGLGARLGDGRQYFPIISLRDWVAAVAFLASNEASSGPYNLCCPMVPTNAEFTEALAHAVGRRARLAAPSRVLRVAAGAMAPELLGSLRTEPAALENDGFKFRDIDGRDVIAAGLHRK